MAHVFISPHFDDAILSVGSLVLELLKNREEVVLITIFSEFSGKGLSFRSRRYIRKCGCRSAGEFGLLRRKEDQALTRKLGIRYCYLGLIDGGFRNKTNLNSLLKIVGMFCPDMLSLYPKHNDIFLGKIDQEDGWLEEAITVKLNSILSAEDIVYGPIGYGEHVDHIITNLSIIKLTNKSYYWLDYPYWQKEGLKLKFNPVFKGYSLEKRVDYNPEKKLLIRCYRSQIESLSPWVLNEDCEFIYKKIG